MYVIRFDMRRCYRARLLCTSIYVWKRERVCGDEDFLREFAELPDYRAARFGSVEDFP